MEAVGENRGRLTATPWMWRRYRNWRWRKGDTRSVVDLCHFMRVLIFFGPWRWFWQANYRGWIYPWSVTLITIFVSTNAYVINKYPDETVEVLNATLYGLKWTAIFGGIACVIVGLVCAALWWYRVDPITVETILYVIGKYGFIWLWWPLWQLWRGIEWVAVRLWWEVLEPVWDRLIHRPLFSFGIKNTLISIWLWYFIPVAIYLGLLYIWTWWTVTITLCVIGVLMVIIFAIAATEMGYNAARPRWIARRDRRARERAERERKLMIKIVNKKNEPEKPKWQNTKIVWAWLVAKKHRVCPLIMPPDSY